MRTTISNLFFAALLASFILSIPQALAAQLDFSFNEGEIVDAVDGKIWTGTFGAGLNGKSGNSENLDINATLNLQRKTGASTTTILASYFYAENTLATTTDRFFGSFRQERNFARNPRWSWFGQATIEVDQFKAFDSRLGLHTGFGFKVYENDIGFLKIRVGGGASRQVGGINDAWVPELQFGGDWERKLTERMKAWASADYFPNVNDFADYRVTSSGGIEYIVDAERNLNLRVFFLNVYDSTPEPTNERNDLDYGIALVLGF